MKYQFALLLAALLGSPGTIYANEPMRIGDWEASINSSYTAFYAATGNGAGSILGQYCFTETKMCYYLIGLRTACEKGGQYPVLVNSDSGAFSLTLQCYGENNSGFYEYAFTDFALVDNIVRQSTRVGFAMPMRGDEFRVVRFSLRGATQAIDGMRSVATKIFDKLEEPKVNFKPAEETL